MDSGATYQFGFNVSNSEEGSEGRWANRRHCERSEAIHASSSASVDCFAALAMMVLRHGRPFPRRVSPGFCRNDTLEDRKRAQGRPGIG
jgi:hypothetical protein